MEDVLQLCCSSQPQAKHSLFLLSLGKRHVWAKGSGTAKQRPFPLSFEGWAFWGAHGVLPLPEEDVGLSQDSEPCSRSSAAVPSLGCSRTFPCSPGRSLPGGMHPWGCLWDPRVCLGSSLPLSVTGTTIPAPGTDGDLCPSLGLVFPKPADSSSVCVHLHIPLHLPNTPQTL